MLAKKRPGKPDTGKPSVRFDEGWSGLVELTTAVGSTHKVHFAYSTLRGLRDRLPINDSNITDKSERVESERGQNHNKVPFGV